MTVIGQPKCATCGRSYPVDDMLVRTARGNLYCPPCVIRFAAETMDSAITRKKYAEKPQAEDCGVASGDGKQ